MLKTKIRKFSRLTFLDYTIFCESLFWIVFTYLKVRLLPYKYIQSGFGVIQNKVVNDSFDSKADLVSLIVLSIRRVYNFLPFSEKSQCLIKVLAGRKMMQHRNISCRIYIGVKKDGTESLKGHAWLTFNSEIILGIKSQQEYQVIAIYN